MEKRREKGKPVPGREAVQVGRRIVGERKEGIIFFEGLKTTKQRGKFTTCSWRGSLKRGFRLLREREGYTAAAEVENLPRKSGGFSEKLRENFNHMMAFGVLAVEREGGIAERRALGKN